MHAAGKIRFGSNATYYGEIDHDAASTGSNIYNSQDNGGHIFQVSGSEKVRIDAGGYVGIGTSSPAELMQLRGSGATKLLLSSADNTTDRGIYFGTSDNTVLGYIKQEYSTGLFEISSGSGAYASGIGFRTGGVANRVVIDSSGRVGIGTASPQLSFVCSNGGANGFEIDPTQSTGTITGINSYNRSSSAFTPLRFNASEHRWDTASTERARIDSSGRLLVGTASARTAGAGGHATLQVKSRSTTDTVVIAAKFQGNTSTPSSQCLLACAAGYNIDANDTEGHVLFGAAREGSGNNAAFIVKTGLSNTERMRITGAGSVWMQTNNNVLYVSTTQGAGTTYEVIAAGHTGTSITAFSASFRVWSNGNVVNTNNSYGAMSDIKLKENIVDASSQWDDLKALQVRNYNFKEGQTHTQIGLVAQEAELVSPGLVSESPDRDEDGNDLGTVTKSVNYSVLYMKAVKALQEAMERIETLEAKVTALETK